MSRKSKDQVTEQRPKDTLDEALWEAAHKAQGSEPKTSFAEYQMKRSSAAMAWRIFARSTAVWTGAIILALGGGPEEIAGGAIVAWVIGRLARVAFPEVYDLNLWMYCSLLVFPVGLWFLRWPAVVIAVIIGTVGGTATIGAVVVAGVLLLIDIVASALRLPL